LSKHCGDSNTWRPQATLARISAADLAKRRTSGWVLQVVVYSGLEFSDALEAPSADRIIGNPAEEALDFVCKELEVGVKCMWKLGQPDFDRRVFMGGVFVGDQMQIERLGRARDRPSSWSCQRPHDRRPGEYDVCWPERTGHLFARLVDARDGVVDDKLHGFSHSVFTRPRLEADIQRFVLSMARWSVCVMLYCDKPVPHRRCMKRSPGANRLLSVMSPITMVNNMRPIT
jgi:hypothetical protein